MSDAATAPSPVDTPQRARERGVRVAKRMACAVAWQRWWNTGDRNDLQALYVALDAMEDNR